MRKKNSGLRRKRAMAVGLAAATMAALPALAWARAPRPAGCTRIVLAGEVSAGQEWKAAFGEGWVFRVLPIHGAPSGAGGWDLVVDRAQPAGFPDALLLATPPYNSISEREIGTTYGLRAQDAIGWNPRSFHFLDDPAALRTGQRLYNELSRESQTARGSAASAALTRKLMGLEGNAAAGELRILDARLVPGVADAAPYAENWALESERTPHQVESSMGNQPTALGRLDWIKFSITLWLPAGWKAPQGVTAAPAGCSE